MAGKMQDDPSTIRVRENQRRSRARRKDLLESLQKRVREFELQGVQATHEMQQAARKVAQENQQLRRLLALHGISREDVESFLRTTDQSNAAQCSQTSRAGPRVPLLAGSPQTTVSPSVPILALSTRTSIAEGPRSSPLPASNSGGRYLSDNPGHGHHISEQDKKIGLSARCQQPPPLERRFSAAEESLSPMSQKTEPCCPTQPISRPSNSVHEARVQEVSEECANQPDCFCPPVPPPQRRESGLGLETSCETAASIIIEMGGHKDRELVRARLGCKGNEDCTVKNTTVLQVMGEL